MKRSPLLRYGVATLAVGLVLLLKLLLDPLITEQSPFLLLAGAVMVSAWFGGLGPGLLATALSALAADYFFLPPVGSFTGLGVAFLPLVLFGLQGLVISSLTEALHSARQRAEESTLEAKRHQEELRRSEERFRLMVEGVKDYAVFMLDPEGRIATWNEGARRINGYRSEEIIGEHFSRFYTQESVERGHPEEELRIAVEEGRYEEEGLRVRKDGSTFWASVVITAVRDKEGTLRGFAKVTRDITEHKEAEEALRQSEQRFRALVQNSSDVITVIDAEGTVRYVSPAVERVTGYRPEELVGKSVFDYVRSDDLNEAQSIVAEAWSRPGVHPPFEFWVPHKDGSWRHSEFLLNNLLDDPSVRGIVVNQRDITERKRAEEELRQSEERYRAVVEQAAENIFLVDAETKRVLEANAALQRSVGYAPEELEQMTLYDIVAHDKESVDLNVERILAGEVFSGERRYRRKDGSLMDVEVNASVLSYGGREVMCVVAHDVTERKRAEQKLRDTLDRLLALYEAGQVFGSSLKREEIASGLLETVERVSEVSATVVDLPDERGRWRLLRTTGPEDLWRWARSTPEALAARRATLESEGYRSFELRPPRADGARLSGLCLPLRVGERIIGMLEAYGPQSLVERGTVEALASLANQAASALENARLYGELAEHRRQLQELVGKLVTTQEEERRRVAYEVHDGLAQTAAAAYQHLQNAIADHPPSSSRDQEGFDQALELIQQTVEEARTVVADLRPTVLDDFGLATALRLQVERFRGEDLQVSYEESVEGERLPAAVETTLFRVAQEALTNVRKHAQTERVRVALERRGQTVRLHVQDWGRGFSPSRVTDVAGPGEKVGLSSMRERVTLLGGQFEIHSEPGAGTLVMAEIPLTEELTEEIEEEEDVDHRE